MNDNLGDRMKAYEAAASTMLPPRMPMLIRVDGRAFHTYTRGFDRPWDVRIRDALTEVGAALLREIPGSKIAYCQSDEVTVLVTDYDSRGFQPWFGKATAKINSVSASIATAAFNRHMTDVRPELLRVATFDARCFVLPQSDVCNAFIWRQKDAERNSILGLSQSIWSHKQMQGLKCDELRDRLEANGTPWEARATWERRGWCVTRENVTKEARAWESITGHRISIDGSVLITRTVIAPDYDPPIFTKDRAYIERHVFLEPTAS